MRYDTKVYNTNRVFYGEKLPGHSVNLSFIYHNVCVPIIKNLFQLHKRTFVALRGYFLHL